MTVSGFIVVPANGQSLDILSGRQLESLPDLGPNVLWNVRLYSIQRRFANFSTVAGVLPAPLDEEFIVGGVLEMERSPARTVVNPRGDADDLSPGGPADGVDDFPDWIEHLTAEVFDVAGGTRLQLNAYANINSAISYYYAIVADPVAIG